MSGQKHRNHQKNLRQKNNEHAFLFDSSVTKCLGQVERDEWELAIEMADGNVSEAAKSIGIMDIPRNARALWGKSQNHALESYRQWCNRKGKMKR